MVTNVFGMPIWVTDCPEKDMVMHAIDVVVECDEGDMVMTVPLSIYAKSENGEETMVTDPETNKLVTWKVEKVVDFQTPLAKGMAFDKWNDFEVEVKKVNEEDSNS